LFTGIVEEVGTVGALEAHRMRVRARRVMEDLKLGDSIAVNGACLTAVALGDGEFDVDLSPETLRRTSIGELSAGKAVNLERPLAVSDRLGGHIVQGHVDAAGRISSSKPEGDFHVIRVRGPKRMMPYIVEKGFIAVDGISLTVVQKDTSSFTLSIIPFTMENTNLKEKGPGDRVNLEFDIVAKYIESLLGKQPEPSQRKDT
jgi:riboflavin synthase